MSSDYTLAYGTHATPDDGRCAMEWVSYLAGEPHSDDPWCVSPVLRAYCTALNDSLDDGPRQRLRPYLARTIGTVGDGLDSRRSWLAMDWLIRTYTPAWLDAAGVGASAEQLAGLPEVEGLAQPAPSPAGAQRRSQPGAGGPCGSAWSGPARGVVGSGRRTRRGARGGLGLGRRRRLGGRPRRGRGHDR